MDWSTSLFSSFSLRLVVSALVAAFTVLFSYCTIGKSGDYCRNYSIFYFDSIIAHFRTIFVPSHFLAHMWAPIMSLHLFWLAQCPLGWDSLGFHKYLDRNLTVLMFITITYLLTSKYGFVVVSTVQIFSVFMVSSVTLSYSTKVKSGLKGCYSHFIRAFASNTIALHMCYSLVVFLNAFIYSVNKYDRIPLEHTQKVGFLFLLMANAMSLLFIFDSKPVSRWIISPFVFGILYITDAIRSKRFTNVVPYADSLLLSILCMTFIGLLVKVVSSVHLCFKEGNYEGLRNDESPECSVVVGICEPNLLGKESFEI